MKKNLFGVLLVMAIAVTACGGTQPNGEQDVPANDSAIEAEASANEPVTIPNWYDVELVDVNTGENFKVSDFQGKVILVETMAVWCPICTDQQRQTKILHDRMDNPEDLISISLDIDPNESPDILKTHTEKQRFDWHFAIVSSDVSREISDLYGGRFLTPPAAPMLIIDREGRVHVLPAGIKPAGALQQALEPHF